MIYTFLKFYFNNREQKVSNYRDFKQFSQEAFKGGLSEALCDNTCDDFDYIFTSKLNKNSLKKKKWIRGNVSPILIKPYLRLL